MARARKQPDTAPAEAGTEARRQRAHKPEALGSRVYIKGGVYYIDERWRRGRRRTLRDPDAPIGLGAGATTRDKKTAESWRNTYDARWRREKEQEASRLTGRFSTIALAVEDFLADRRRQNARSTHSGSCTATSYLVELVGPLTDPAKVSTWEIQVMFNELLEAGYMPSTLHNLRYHLRAFFNHTKVNANPVRDVKLPKMGKANIKPWNERQRNQVRKAADAIDKARGDTRRTCRHLIELLLSMGLRVQEAAAVSWDDIDPKLRVIRVAHQICRFDNVAKDTKGKEPRSVTILPEWWNVHDRKGRGLILASPDGSPIPYMTLYKYVAEILKSAGLKEPGVAAHQGRHTYAFVFIEMGGTLDQLSKCLGHKKLSTTQKYYEHFTSTHAAAAAARHIYQGTSSVRRGPRKKA